MANARKKHHVIIGASAAGLAAWRPSGRWTRNPRSLSGRRVVIAIWPEALNQGRVAGLNMAGHPTTYQGSMAMNVTSVLGLPVASLGLWRVTDTSEYRIHATSDDTTRTYRKLVFKDGTLVGAILAGPIVNGEAGILHNFIRTRQSFTVNPEQLMAGPIAWGRILRDSRPAGATQ